MGQRDEETLNRPDGLAVGIRKLRQQGQKFSFNHKGYSMNRRPVHILMRSLMLKSPKLYAGVLQVYYLEVEAAAFFSV